MGYIHDLERELRELLRNSDEVLLIKFVKEKVLESYRNGIMAAKMVEADQEAERKTKKLAQGK